MALRRQVMGQDFPQFAHVGAREGERVCYLEHLDKPIKHARHYQHSTDDLDQRESQQGGPHGPRLLQVASVMQIGWHPVRTWVGGRDKERALKGQSGARYCPECAEFPKPGLIVRPEAEHLTRRQRAERQAARQRQIEIEPEP
jgi:hypothetical protein